MARPGIPNLRIRRRNETYRKVEKPEDVELTRRPKAEKPSEAIKAAVLAALLVGGSISDAPTPRIMSTIIMAAEV